MDWAKSQLTDTSGARRELQEQRRKLTIWLQCPSTRGKRSRETDYRSWSHSPQKCPPDATFSCFPVGGHLTTQQQPGQRTTVRVKETSPSALRSDVEHRKLGVKLKPDTHEQDLKLTVESVTMTGITVGLLHLTVLGEGMNCHKERGQFQEETHGATAQETAPWKARLLLYYLSQHVLAQSHGGQLKHITAGMFPETRHLIPILRMFSMFICKLKNTLICLIMICEAHHFFREARKSCTIENLLIALNSPN